MATTTITTLTCDFFHLGETTAEKTITIGWEGRVLEAEACTLHVDAIRDALGPYIQDMRPATRAAAKAKAPRTAERRAHMAGVRAWAKRQGMGVDDRGRIPVRILNAYNEAH